MTDKVRENALRRKADRCGYMLRKSRTRDPQGIDYGLYAVVDVRSGFNVNPALADRWGCSWTLDQVEGFLND